MLWASSSPMWARLSDRYGRKPVLIVSQIGTLVGFLVLAAARSLADALELRIAERTRIKDALASMHPVWTHLRGGSDRVAAAEMKDAMNAVLERVL